MIQLIGIYILKQYKMKKKAENILGKLGAVWFLITFFATMLIFWIPMWATRFLPETKRSDRFIFLSRMWMRVFFVFSGIRLKVTGLENFKKGENYVVVCNHNSFLDVPLSSPFIPGPNKTIAKHEFSRIPIFGMIYRGGSVLVNRKSDQSRKESYQAMHQVLQMGMHMCIYPEGTRNRSGEPLKTFHDGAFKLAVSAQKAMIPAVIFNTGKSMPANKGLYFKPMPLAIHFLPPVYVNKDTDAQELKENVYKIMWDHIESRKKANGSYRL